MWRADGAGEVIGVFIGAQRISVGLLAGQGVRADTVFSVAVDQPGAWALLTDWLAPHLRASRRSIRVGISDHWLAVDGLPWSPALLKQDQAHRHVRDHLLAAGYALMPDDVVALDDVPRGQPRMVVAYPARFMSALGELAAGLQARQASVLPMSTLAWRWGVSGHRGGALLGIVEDQALLLLQGHRRIESFVGRRLPAADGAGASAPSAALRQLWRRQGLRHPAWESPVSAKLLNLSAEAGPPHAEAPAPWQPLAAGQGEGAARSTGLFLLVSGRDDVSTLNPVRQRPHWAWLLLAALLALSLAWLGRGLNAENARHDMAVIGAAQAADTPGPASGTPPASPVDAKRLRAVNAAIAQLNMPVGRLLQALQAPKDIDVKVSSFKVAGMEATVVAEAAGSDDMVRYVDFLATSAPFTSARLKQHTWVEGPAGRLHRFSLEASWQQP